MEKIKRFSIENILCLFIVLCPVLDMVSFLYRNIFNTNFSPSTFVRPIISIVVIIYLFFTKNKKFKIYSFLTFLLYAVYGGIHLYLFEKVKTGSNYSNIVHEAQYIINYSFMIFISIFTNTSSNTYLEEKMGYKGWFESGNSIGAILILSIFIYICYIKDKKYRKIAVPLLILNGIFLTFLIGTRVGLFGFILVLSLYIIVEILYSLLKNKKVNKKLVFIASISIIAIALLVVIFGSTTLERRKHLKQIEDNIVDASLEQNSHITGDLLDIKNKIDNNQLENGYMNQSQKESILDLYNIANSLNVSNNDQRMQQLIYNISLVKNQKNIWLILFGNGYMANFRELILEMEIPAFLFNFGLFGFTLYFVPFLSIFIYGIYFAFKYRKKIDDEFIMLLLRKRIYICIIIFFRVYIF